jgi:exopolyphosphatase/guanosine-5'-triphosphate,3'-diphosphate pyrophosphatase
MALKTADSSGAGFRLSCRNDWAQSFPQSAHLLHEEVLAWEKTPWKLELKGF